MKDRAPNAGPTERVSARRLAPVLLVIAMVVALGGTQYMRQEVRWAGLNQASLEVAETFYVPPVIVLKVLALGHEPFMADMLYMRGNHYFLSHLAGDRRYPWLDTYIETVLALDRHIASLYRWASMAAKWGQIIDREAVEKSIHYAELGLDVFPDDWRLYVDIGFNYYYEWKPTDEADRKRAQELAREYFSVAASLPGSTLDPNFVTELFMRDNETKMALFHAYTRYADASDREREELRHRIRVMQGEDAARELERADAAWKEHFPFVSRSFFELLGEPPDPRVPRSWDELATVRALELDG